MSSPLKSQGTRHKAQGTILFTISGLDPWSTLAIAVSGGADSMALLLLANDWAKNNKGKIIALTVDHGLRAESVVEAAQVKKWCEKLGVEHHTLRIQDSGFRIQKKTQDAYRIARYRLLTDWCKAHKIFHLLTAHHLDDQVETLFMRLSRGSFIDGLACMAPVRKMHDISLVRPLLVISKPELISYLQSRRQSWIEDPTNADPRYTRNRLRKLLKDDNFKIRAANVIDVFARARAILDRQVSEAIATCVENKDDKIIMLLAPYCALPPEIARRALARMIQDINHEDHPPRTEKLMRLTNSIMDGTLIKRRTLGGLVFAPLKNGRELHIYKEHII